MAKNSKNKNIIKNNHKKEIIKKIIFITIAIVAVIGFILLLYFKLKGVNVYPPK